MKIAAIIRIPVITNQSNDLTQLVQKLAGWLSIYSCCKIQSKKQLVAAKIYYLKKGCSLLKSISLFE
jgi:hypothetical protein